MPAVIADRLGGKSYSTGRCACTDEVRRVGQGHRRMEHQASIAFTVVFAALGGPASWLWAAYFR